MLSDFFYVPEESIICQNVAIVSPSTNWENDGGKLFAYLQDGALFWPMEVSTSFALHGFYMLFQNLSFNSLPNCQIIHKQY